MAAISSEVATGRRMNGREGLTLTALPSNRVCPCQLESGAEKILTDLRMGWAADLYPGRLRGHCLGRSRPANSFAEPRLESLSGRDAAGPLRPQIGRASCRERV